MSWEALRAEEVRARSDAIRGALDPLVLPRVTRPSVENYCQAVLRDFRVRNEPGILAVVGPAGFGKTTILGALYDWLVQEGLTWVLVVRCTELDPDNLRTSDKLSHELSRVALGVSASLTEVVEYLTQKYGPGSILIDTLDLVLDRAVLSRLNTLFEQLAAYGMLVVFTCRDIEYEGFIEPVQRNLPAFTSMYDRCWVYEFSPLEARQAILSYISERKTGVTRREAGNFAVRILGLAADNRSLRDIALHPLLLGMLCALFGDDLRVPGDMTVSTLYEKYWQEKVGSSRRSGAHEVGLNKESICFRIARLLFLGSDGGIRESLFRADVVKDAEYDLLLAWSDLLSEGVLEPARPANRARFFHQTFLEYALARWLASRDGAPFREDLYDRAARGIPGQAKLHWWPVVRQFASVVDQFDVEVLIGQFDLARLEAFRGVSLGLASRSDPPQLDSRLLSVAMDNGVEHQKVLLLAAEMAAPRARKAAWEVIVALLGKGEVAVAAEASRVVGYFLRRWDTDISLRLTEALDAVEQRAPLRRTKRKSTDEVAPLQGRIVESCVSVLEDPRSIAALGLLRQRFHRLGWRTKKTVLRLHGSEHVPGRDAIDLIDGMVGEPLRKRFQPEVRDLIANLLRRESSATSARDFLTSLYRRVDRLPNGWVAALEAASGRASVESQSRLRELVNRALFEEGTTAGNFFVPVLQAIADGASSEVLAILLSVDMGRVLPSRLGVVSAILRELHTQITADQADALAARLEPVGLSHPEKVISGVGAISVKSTRARILLAALLEVIPTRKRPRYIINVLRTFSLEPDESFAVQLYEFLPKDAEDASSRVALVEILAILARTRREPLRDLLELSMRSTDRVALAASGHLVELSEAGLGPPPEDLSILSSSSIPGVRVNWLLALGGILDRARKLEYAILTQATTALEREEAEPVAHAFRRFLVRWRKIVGDVPLEVGKELARLGSYWLFTAELPGGIRRSGLAVLSNIARGTRGPMLETMGSLASKILQEVDVRRFRDGELQTVNLLAALGKRNATFFSDIIDLGASVRASNWRPVAIAIRRVQGSSSDLFDRMLGAAWCPAEARSQILMFRRS